VPSSRKHKRLGMTNNHRFENVTDKSVSVIDDKIVYHEELEHLAMQAGDFTKAEHHRKMQEIYRAMKESETAA
jgi:hypothetical protein